MEQPTKRFCMLAVFTVVVICNAILIVSLASLKSRKTCEFNFKRMNKSKVAPNSRPHSIAVGDFNNDNYIDIVVANSGTDTIGIFFGQINQTFTDQYLYPTGSGSSPYSLVVHDFNNDHYLDIAVANYGTNNLGMFLGTNNGMFHNQRLFSLGSCRPFFISTADLNNDTKADIVIVNQHKNAINILLGHGNGYFRNAFVYSTDYDSQPYSLAIGDFNKDNVLDIAVVNYGTNNIGIFLGYGDGTFRNQKTYETSLNSKPSSIVLGDLNHDNHLDILVTNYGTGNIGIFLGYDNGTFSEQTTLEISSKSHPSYITVGDFDKDSRLDIVVVDTQNDQLHILLKYDENKSFQTTTYDEIIDSSPFFVAVADFDNDSQSDIALVNKGTHSVVLLSKYFVEPSTRQTDYFIGEDSRSSSIVVYDFNYDNELDLLVNNFNNDSLLLLLGNENGTFTKDKAYFTGNKSAPKCLCIGDVNNDNQIDIVIANYGSDSIGILLGDDRRTFADVKTYFAGVGSQPWFVAIGNFNDDNRLDVVTANVGLGGVSIFLGHGDGTFDNVNIYFTDMIIEPLSVVVHDINNDKYSDLIVAVCGSNNIAILLGKGDGTFSYETKYFFGDFTCPNSINLVDLNNDNFSDLIVSTLNGGFVSILFGYDDGNFSNPTIYSTGPTASHYSIAVDDFNNDNQHDFVVSNIANNELMVFYGYDNGHFRLERKYSTGFGSSPYAVTTAKFKNKNETNIIVTLWGIGHVAILTEYDAAKFKNRKTYSTGSSPKTRSVAVGHFRDNKHVDIAIVNSGLDTLDILFNSGNGTFLTQTKISMDTDSYPTYVTTADINTDNNLDIVTVNSKNKSISVILGHGNGSFEIPIMYSTGEDSYPLSVAIDDMNNDNASDIVIADAGKNTVDILFRFNYTTFESKYIDSNDNNKRPSSIVTSDFNNDTYLDIAVAFLYSHSIGILLGYGNGSFSSMMTYSIGKRSETKSLNVHDFNNDGRLDILVVDSDADEFFFLLGCGNGSFRTIIRHFSEKKLFPCAVALTDINNDGQIDLILVYHTTDTVGILLGNGNLTFNDIAHYSAGKYSNPKSIAVGDFDSDGQIDIAISNYGTSTVNILLNYTNGNFLTQTNYSTGYQSWPAWITVADFNGDHQLDLAVVNYNLNNVGIFIGYGNGSFASMVPYSTGHGSSPRFLDIGDFNNDFVVDIAVTNYGTNDIVILFGYGDGTFLLGTAYESGLGSAPYALAIGDFNMDHRLDIAVTNHKSNDINIFLAYGTEFYAGVTSYSTGSGSYPRSVAIRDLNSDGLLDIVVANFYSNSIGVLLALRHGVFSSLISCTLETDSGPYSIAIADFNDDYQPDIVVSFSKSNKIAILLGIGNGSFFTHVTYSTGTLSQPYAVAIDDFDNDNVMDIAVANSGTNNILLLHGSGNGYFENIASYTLGYKYRPHSIVVTDLNQDGWMDIAIACYGTDHVEVLIKIC